MKGHERHRCQRGTNSRRHRILQHRRYDAEGAGIEPPPNGRSEQHEPERTGKGQLKSRMRKHRRIQEKQNDPCGRDRAECPRGTSSQPRGGHECEDERGPGRGVRKADEADVEPSDGGGVDRSSTRAGPHTANDDTHEERHDAHMEARDREQMSDPGYGERLPNRGVQCLLSSQNQGAGQRPRLGQKVPHPRFDPSPEARPGSRQLEAGHTLVELHVHEQKCSGRGRGRRSGVGRPPPGPYSPHWSPGGMPAISSPLEGPDGALTVQAADQPKRARSCSGPTLEPTADRPLRSIRQMEPAVAARLSTLRVGREAAGEHGQGQCRRHHSSVHRD